MSTEDQKDTQGEPETPDAEVLEPVQDEVPADDAVAGEPTAEKGDGAAGEAMAPEPEPEAPAHLDSGQLMAIIEAILFASPEPITLKTLTRVLSDEPKEDVTAAFEALRAEYEGRRGLHLALVAGGYQIMTRPELHDWVRRLFHERTTQKLSVQSLETLAVIAYKQPITAAEIGEIRGVNTSGVLSTLLERHLVKIVGRKNVVGRPFLYGTTKEFLIRFGLKDLADLPKVEDMAAALGFEAPAVLTERPVTDDMLPLDEGDLAAIAASGGSTEDEEPYEAAAPVADVGDGEYLPGEEPAAESAGDAPASEALDAADKDDLEDDEDDEDTDEDDADADEDEDDDEDDEDDDEDDDD